MVAHNLTAMTSDFRRRPVAYDACRSPADKYDRLDAPLPGPQPRPADWWLSTVSRQFQSLEGVTVMWILAALACSGLVALAAFIGAARRRPVRPSDLTPVSDGWRGEQRARSQPD
jgi:hypothetical protein